MYKMGNALALSCLLLLGTAGCSSVPTDEANGASTANDPFEGFNRVMWDFNFNYLDPYIVRPVSLGYVEYTPEPVRTGIANFLSNLDEPASVVNNLLMGNGTKAMDHFNRFWINSSLGLLGFIDVAGYTGITKQDNKSFGDAVGHWGVGNGPYLMIPAVGPYTVRETTDFVDGLYVPLSLLNFWAGVGKWALEGMETRASLEPQQALIDDSPDPYILTREIYLQRQDFKAEVEAPEENAEEEALLDEYLEDDFDFE
ncbi:VacJ family lipoprotein [Vibrio sp. SM6]|uniref:VacJ family lipoprotein n=1 Tax=Vibrio agarilyticus TaxID=2726741 RepID=A0A7X8TRH0_9VIBR|nr:MlaA family lipoprotein [Vibrio agarilyticus]NLS13262.1 VacJ family lipoprotein [Vibrio agarilyticus]